MALHIPVRRRGSRRVVSAIIFALALGTLVSMRISFGDTESSNSPSQTSKANHLGSDRLGLKSSHKHQQKVKPAFVYDKAGLIRGWDSMLDGQESESANGHGGQVGSRVLYQHPIEDLIASGQERWNEMLSSQSRTLSQAVKEYQRRYGRLPPKGFDKWFKFCQDNNVKIIDDYDQINRDIEPYFALSPELFARRVKDLQSSKFSYNITLSPHSPSSIAGERGAESRPKSLFSLLEPIAQFLPADVVIYGSDHDMGSWLLGDDQRQAAMQAIRASRYLTEEELVVLERRNGRGAVGGLVSACPEDSPAWQMRLAEKNGEQVDIESTESSFVYDPRPGYDFCYTPKNLLLHGALSFDFSRESILRPLFQLSKFSRSPELLTTPLQAYDNVTSKAAIRNTMDWHEKTLDQLFWRGSSTGDSYSKIKHGKAANWRLSHRPRLHLLAQNGTGTAKVLVERNDGWVAETWSREKLNGAYLDVGLSGKPHQCSVTDGTCAEMQEEIIFKDRIGPEQSSKYKYVLDVDGNGWSSRFNRLLMSGSVVLKTTIYPEWNSDWLIPWVHYVPVQIDYSDLHNIMSFFVGPPDAPGSGRDDLARDIAQQARSFGMEHWRWEDMQAYMFRTLIEYARLMAEDRETWVYTS